MLCLVSVGEWYDEDITLDMSYNQTRNKQFTSDLGNSGSLASRKGFLEELVEKKAPSELKARPVQGAIVKTDMTSSKRTPPAKNSELKTLVKETQKKLKLLEGRDLFSSREVQLWKTEAWRRREKDLSSNYSKLSPIEEGRTEQSVPYH